MTASAKASPDPSKRWAPPVERSKTAWLAPSYFALYLAYLFLYQENELQHWISLVLLPALLVYVLHRVMGIGPGATLHSLGLAKGALRRGLLVAIALGLVLSVFQVSQSRYADQILEIFRSGRAAWLFPLSFVLMFLTAGFTEEFFFRGFLQTRLEQLLGSRIAGLFAASLCFGVYHLPYAYFNPNWPSAGDWGAAWSSALGQGVPGGLILGALYLYSGRNLLAPAVLHALINALPAMGMIRFGSG